MNLKPCPFCGSTHLVKEIKPSAWNSNELEHHIICNDCASSGPVYIWNARVEDQGLRSEKMPARKQSASDLVTQLRIEAAN
ncbi:Lar family restriction alleviation protein [Vibrio coralliilyticus]|uniref:Lar family restriction alleviation protein n=1 Tax=Vibrio coralliilyticus TaxID=190893 RepID=UPI000A121370